MIQSIMTAAVIILFDSSGLLHAQEYSLTEEPVWHWFGNCPAAHVLEIEVLQGNKVLLKTRAPICEAQREQIAPESPQKILKFEFKADAKIFGEEFKSLGERKIEGNIWQAGTDPSDVLLGVSFVAEKKLLLNTVHMATPDKLTEAAVAEGLTVRTKPIPAKKPAAASKN